MKYTKEDVERRLYMFLSEMMSDYNQDSAIISIEYNEEEQNCTVKLNVVFVEDDDYVGFNGY